AVADLEQGARDEDRDVEGAACDELAIVEVAGVTARRDAADAARVGGGGDSHAAVERVEGNDDSRLELGGHLLAVELKDLGGDVLLAVLGEIAIAAVVAVVEGEIDRQDLDLEDVSRLGALDEDR